MQQPIFFNSFLVNSNSILEVILNVQFDVRTLSHVQDRPISDSNNILVHNIGYIQN